MAIKMEADSNKFPWKLLLRQMLVSSSSWAFYFMFGMVLGTPTVTIPQLRSAANSTEAVSIEMASWISSIVGYVGMIWVFILTISAHQFGLKRTISIEVINAVAANGVLFFSRSATHVLISQVLHGCTAATQTSTAILVLTEYISPRYRGLFLTIKSASLFWGIWVANALGLYFPYKYIAVFGLLCNVYVVIIILIIPESPYWLAKKERYDECVQSHRWLKGDDSVAEKELEDLIATQRTYKRKKPKKTLMQYIWNYGTVIRQPETYKPLAVAYLLHAIYHMSGKLVLTMYSIDIIKKITNSQSAANIGMLILDGITILGMYTGCALSKILKRRQMFLFATSTSTMFLFIIAAYLYLIKFGIIKENAYVSIALLMAFSVAVACGPLIMSSSIAGELIPVKSRSFCVCIVAFMTKLNLGIVLKIAPFILRSFGTHGSFLFFAVGSTVLTMLAYFYLPETKDKTLLQISDYFRKDKATESELVSLAKQTTP